MLIRLIAICKQEYMLIEDTSKIQSWHNRLENGFIQSGIKIGVTSTGYYMPKDKNKLEIHFRERPVRPST